MRRIHLMTYNIRLALDSSLAVVAQRIRESGADIVALQEVGRRWTMGDGADQPSELARLLGFHASYAPALHERDGQAQYGIATLTRWPIEHEQQLLLPRITDEQRSALFIDVAGPQPITLVNTHLSVVPADCDRQWPLLLKELGALERPWIILGDFNFDCDSLAFAAFARVFSTCGDDRRPSFPSGAPQRRIDHVFLDPQNWQVIEPARPLAVSGSDHLPVCATVGLSAR